MKVSIIQPPYSADASRADENFQWELDALRACDPSLDLIVLPESCDVPCFFPDRAGREAAHAKYADPLLNEAKETAKRCHAVVFFNIMFPAKTGMRSTTLGIGKDGEIFARYYKAHLTPGEVSGGTLDYAYTYEPFEPTVVTYESVRYAFLTCYDFYFYEAFPRLAKERPDIVIGCSHQRTDRPDVLEMMTKFCAYNCNAFVVRASVSMGEDSDVGGMSMIATPDGHTLVSLGSHIGSATAEIDPHEKYLKSPGFLGKVSGEKISHFDYTERGRRPWQYRPAGPALCSIEEKIPYPRLCAHRGFNTSIPENSMPAFGAAVALGATEIEFDLRATADGEIVSTHDSKLERVSDGTGLVSDYTLAELQTLDFGVKKNPAFAGLRIVRFEEILRKFACHVIMNIHIKSPNNVDPLDDSYLQKIIDLIDKYDCRKWVYFMSGNDAVLAQLQRLAPDITRCVGGGDAPYEEVERALRYDCKKIQLVKSHFTQEMIDRAHANGIRCNIFWSDDPEEAQRFFDMGIDTVLTNDYQRVFTGTLGKA